jgi:hypothetical protein
VLRVRRDRPALQHNRYEIEPFGRYRRFECIQQRDEQRYSVRGAVMEEDKVISTWALELAAEK